MCVSGRCGVACHTSGSLGLQHSQGRNRGHPGEFQVLETVSNGEWVPGGREGTKEYFGEKGLQKQGCEVRTLKDQRSWRQEQQPATIGSRLFSTTNRLPPKMHF